MAIQALTAQFVSIGTAGDISAYCKSATLTIDVAQLDSTDFASDGWTESHPGLKSATLAVELMDDVAAGSIDADFWADLGTSQAFEVRIDNAVVGAGNPSYTGNVQINSWNIGGAVGDLATKSYSFPVTGAVSRAVS